MIVSRSDIGSNQGEGVRTDLEWWFNDLLYAFLVMLWAFSKVLAPMQVMVETEEVKKLGLAYRIGRKIV